jgi:hypothetical protein
MRETNGNITQIAQSALKNALTANPYGTFTALTTVATGATVTVPIVGGTLDPTTHVSRVVVFLNGAHQRRTIAYNAVISGTNVIITPTSGATLAGDVWSIETN